MKLTLGPVPFNWTFNELVAFYNIICETAIDEVYLGETVCFKRGMLTIDQFQTIVSMLENAGKKVNISTLILVRNEDELDSIRDIVKLGHTIEANNTAVLNMVDKTPSSIIIGPYVPVYNRPTVLFFADTAKRIVLTPELSYDTICEISKNITVEIELISYGRLPLGNSGTCYSARYEGLEIENCCTTCETYKEGIDTKAISGEDLWNINGTQILSAKKVCILKDLEKIQNTGVTHLRIVPQLNELKTIIDIYKQTIDENLNPEIAVKELEVIENGRLCNGWFKNSAGLDYI